MGQSVRFFLFLCYILRYSVVSSSPSSFSSSSSYLCPRDQRLALLQLKRMVTINSDASFGCDSSYPKTMSWNESTLDCCSWDGVTCDVLTGHVIGLDLSCSQLYGTIHPNSSLFQLFHLQKLNLSYNDFNHSYISSAFGRFVNLTHLSLFYSSFSGLIPSEISHLSKLVSLHLSSWDGLLSLEPHNFKMIMQNLTQLQELVLTQVNISSALPNSLMTFSSLTTLDLGWTGLLGNLPDDLFNLPNLQKLNLQGNSDLIGNLPKVNWSNNSSLKELDLSTTSLSGELPNSIGYLESLNYLSLSYCKFSGSIPESLGNLTQINEIDLSGNSFSGQVPHTLSNLKQLTRLSLSSNNLKGQFPNSFGKLIKLEFLTLRENCLNGQLPLSMANLTQLVYLDISNNALTGPIPSNITGLLSLVELYMSSNQLIGQIPEFQHKSELEYLVLSNNELQGPIPQSISKLVNLTCLYLSSNNLSGVVDLQLFSNIKKLEYLDLSHNNLSVGTGSNANTTFPNLLSLYLSSCNINKVPNFLRNSKNLQQLDLSNNNIHGQIPKWVGETSFTFLDLSHNYLQGSLPIPPLSTFYFFISHNKLTGDIPSSVCNLSSLDILDLSYNNLSGVIPQCLGNSSKFLSVLDLRMNGFHGIIPTTFAEANRLRNLNLNGNLLEGPVPPSLANCKCLEVLDLGNNKINDTFPNWVETLPELQVLVLRSNRFHGPIGNSKTIVPFPKLRIFDLAHNEFTSFLPSIYFHNFKAMGNVDGTKKQLNYMGQSYYRDSVELVLKGVVIEVLNILTMFTTIDFSNNKFKGEIPNVIGRLQALRLLNLSHNSLMGPIPPSLGNVTMLESLDLSSNQLTGEIPGQLTSLTFLAVLNLSTNHLVGPIPQSTQLDTFQNDSYAGNLGLCGFPLSKECEDIEAKPQPPLILQQEDDLDFASELIWEALLMGYGCGIVFGLVMGYLLFLTGRPKWLARIVEGKKRRKVKRSNQIDYELGGSTNHHEWMAFLELLKETSIGR